MHGVLGDEFRDVMESVLMQLRRLTFFREGEFKANPKDQKDSIKIKEGDKA
jgi:hypothetical protein